jgi:tetratricopeptide (TPR) repeat protein
VYVDQLGNVYLELGNMEMDGESLYAEAETYFRKAMALNPSLKNDAIQEFLEDNTEEIPAL